MTSTYNPGESDSVFMGNGLFAQVDCTEAASINLPVASYIAMPNFDSGGLLNKTFSSLSTGLG